MHICQLLCHNQGIYLNKYMQLAKLNSFRDGGSCSANQWTGFCIIETSVMKDSKRSSSTYIESLFLHVEKHNLRFSF